MPMKSLFGKVYDVLGKSLDITKYQHGLISSNIANIDTPGYKTSEISFKKTLEKTLGDDYQVKMLKTNAMHIGPTKGQVQLVKSARDTDPIDIDIEMSKLAQNNLRFRIAAQALGSKFKGYKDLISKAAG